MSSSRPRRILFLNQTYLPDPVATSQYLARWAEHLAREGNEVTVLAGRRAYHEPGRRHPREEDRNGVRVVRVATTGFGKGASWRRALDFASFLIAAFLRGLFLPRPDVIVALTSPPLVSIVAAVLAARFRARFVYWVMDLHPDAAVAAGRLNGHFLAGRMLERLSCWSLRRAHRIIVLDRHIKERLLAKRISGEKIEVIPLWMQADVRFEPAGREAVRRARGWEDKCVVMLAGNHGPCHSLETLLSAIGEFSAESCLHFCFVGGGSQWPRLRARAAGCRNITLIDYVRAGELAATLSAADLQVVIMGDRFVGRVHPSKIYNLLATERPLIYIGPASGPIADLMATARLNGAASSFRHGESAALARHLKRLAQAGPPSWPATAQTARWQEKPLLEKMTSALGYAGR